MHIADLYFRGFTNHPDRLALTGEGGDFSYRQAHALTQRIARRLRDAGLTSGDRFAVHRLKDEELLLCAFQKRSDDCRGIRMWFVACT